jgi:glycosyltransferase involved in cell wall biosynthesis
MPVPPSHRQIRHRGTVCIDARYVRERPSGIGLLVEELVSRVGRLAPDLDFVFLKHPRRSEPLSKEPNVREVVVPWEANGPVTLLALARVVDLRKVDVFHAPFNIMPAGLRMPTVVTIHDLMWIHRPELARRSRVWGSIEQAFYANGIRRALRHAAAIVTVSQCTRDEMVGRETPGRASIRVIPPAGHEGFGVVPPHAISERLRRLGLNETPYVLAVGQSAPYKNHVGIVRGFALAFADRPEIRLVVVQRLHGHRSLERLAAKLGIGDRLILPGAVPRDDLAALYGGAVALCHPSHWEGFGLPIAEAMACGCPIIASSVGAMPEVAGDAALYADPEDPRSIANALQRIERDPSLGAALRKRGLARVRALSSWDAFALQHVELYRELIRNGSYAPSSSIEFAESVA